MLGEDNYLSPNLRQEIKMFFSKEDKKRIDLLEEKLYNLNRSYKDLLDYRNDFSNTLKRTFDAELASYRAAIQGTQTDRIKFGVLEEWINDVFKLNGLKFSDKDFIEKSEEQMLREKIAKEIESSVIEVAGNSAETMRQAANIARGVK